MEDLSLETIECGIGKINYIVPENLQLLQLMEALTLKIAEVGPAETLKLLS